MATDKMAGHYIWLTRGDSKVRASHAERDGTMFSWNKPPQGGHPGQEYNCRCRAIPITAEHQLPIPALNPDNPLRYRDLVEFGLITKFNKMTQDRNKFLDADTAADIHEQRKQEGTRFKPGTTGMVLARRVNTRDDAARSGADFAAAVRDKGLDNDRSLKEFQEEAEPAKAEEVPSGWPGSLKLLLEYASGTGPAKRVFTEGSPQVEDMKTSLGIREVKEKYRNKYKNLLLDSKEDVDLTGTSYTNYPFTFRLIEFLDAGFNPTQHFVGSYNVDIFGFPNGKVKIKVRNNTSFISLMYQIPGIPSWEREKFRPMGNMRQEFIWTEKFSP